MRAAADACGSVGAKPIEPNQSAEPRPSRPSGPTKLGRDVFSRIVYGARISIRIGFLAVGLAIVAGTAIG